MTTSLNLEFEKTVLVLIDLQKGIVPMDKSGTVVPNAKKLIDVFREKGGFISFVNVDFHDGADALKPLTDEEAAGHSAPPADWAEFVPDIGVKENDYTVTKRQWGAFFGTEPEPSAQKAGNRHDCVMRDCDKHRCGKHGARSFSARVSASFRN